MKSTSRIELFWTAGLGTAVALASLHHGTVYRDRYATREDCLRDWGREERDCRSGESHGGSSYIRGSWYGPSYEERARPYTSARHLSRESAMVERAGFGRSGARYVRSGG